MTREGPDRKAHSAQEERQHPSGHDISKMSRINELTDIVIDGRFQSWINFEIFLDPKLVQVSQNQTGL